MDFQEDAYEDLFDQQSQPNTPGPNQPANDFWPIEAQDERALNNDPHEVHPKQENLDLSQNQVDVKKFSAPNLLGF